MPARNIHQRKLPFFDSDRGVTGSDRLLGDGRVSYTFTDCLGRTVLQRMLADNGATSDTYTVSDPLAEKYYPISLYSYCAADPINLIDPSGLGWVKSIKTNDYVWMSDVNKASDTPNGYIYIGGSNEDILRDLNITERHKATETKFGGGFEEDHGRIGYLAGSVKIDANVVVELAQSSKQNPKDPMDSTFDGIKINAFVSQKQTYTNSDYAIIYNGWLVVSIDGKVFRAQLLKPKASSSYYLEEGAYATNAALFIPKKYVINNRNGNIYIKMGTFNICIPPLMPFEVEFKLKK